MIDGQNSSCKYFHSVVPVGIAIISADEIDSKMYIEIIDSPDNFFLRMAFMAIPPSNRTDFFRMLESIGRISKLLCYRVETVDNIIDGKKLFEEQSNELQISYLKTNRALWIEVYGRN